jgi:N-dimethylarginine dimethylaminohydrolase
VSVPAPSVATDSAARHSASVRNYLMCRPKYFTVNYSVNPFMHPERPTNTALAVRQWENLRDTYRLLGHHVTLLDPVPGLVDMVFTANGGFTLDSRAYVASFVYPQRQPEAAEFDAWFRRNGFDTHQPGCLNEGEGDFAVVGDVILAGCGFRSDRRSHAEVARVFGREVISLTLVDPRFYHLDVALTVLDSAAESGPARIAYLPSAFDEGSREVLAKRFPKAILVDEEEAARLALNSVSDGRHVVVAENAPRYIRQLLAHGFTPVPVDLSELLKGGGGVKCCTQELRR